MTQISPRQPILLIDDSPEDLYLATLLLERAAINHPIVTKADGEEAIGFLQAALAGASDALPFCVFSDIRMPKVNGFGVLEWSRAQGPLGKTTFAMLTGGNLARSEEHTSE